MITYGIIYKVLLIKVFFDSSIANYPSPACSQYRK